MVMEGYGKGQLYVQNQLYGLPAKRRHVVHQKMSRKLLPPPRASCPGSSRNAHEPRQLEHRVLACESEGEGRNQLLSETRKRRLVEGKERFKLRM